MNLYKFNFDLSGSSNALKTITIPTDSKYSIGVKFFNGNEELILGDDVTVTIQDDKYIYTPTEIFNNYAVFAGSTDNGGKSFKVNYHKDGKEMETVNETNVIQVPSGGAFPRPRSINFQISLQNILDFCGDNVDNIIEAYDKFKFTVAQSSTEAGVKLDKHLAVTPKDMGANIRVNETGFVYGQCGGWQIQSRKDSYTRLIYSKLGNKVGWVLYHAVNNDWAIRTPITEDMFVDGQKITELYNGDFAGSDHNWGAVNVYTTYFDRVEIGDWYQTGLYFGDEIPQLNVQFNGFDVKVNDSAISQWAITNSQMKVVYTDEWETMKDNADDRVIYFVVDRPTPPKPVPPKPVPPKPTPSGEWRILLEDASESDTFDPTNIEDCLSKVPGQLVKYTRDGVDYYLSTQYYASPTAEVRGEAIKVDQIALMWQPYQDYDNRFEEMGFCVKDGYLNVVPFVKHFNTVDEMYEYEDNYMISRFGEEFDQPNTSYPIPEDFDTWEIEEESGTSIPITNETNDYVYVEENEFGPAVKLLKNIDTFVQWVSDEPS